MKDSSAKRNCRKSCGIYTEIDERTRLEPLSQLFGRSSSDRCRLRARALNLTQPTLAAISTRWTPHWASSCSPAPSRGWRPTEAALELAPYAENVAANTAAMLRTASGLGATVKGTVRISASEIVGAEILPAVLTRLRRQHSELEFELVLSNTIDNLLRRDADIAVRMVEHRHLSGGAQAGGGFGVRVSGRLRSQPRPVARHT
jgi:hypothetical protein